MSGLHVCTRTGLASATGMAKYQCMAIGPSVTQCDDRQAGLCTGKGRPVAGLLMGLAALPVRRDCRFNTRLSHGTRGKRLLSALAEFVGAGKPGGHTAL